MNKKTIKLLMVGILSLSMVACSSTDKKESETSKWKETQKDIILVTTTSL